MLNVDKEMVEFSDEKRISSATIPCMPTHRHVQGRATGGGTKEDWHFPNVEEF